MTATATLTIEILSYWHAGSGYGLGAALDAVVIKDAQGLPYLPGRTVKGLLRDGMQTLEEIGQVAEGTTHRLFGAPTETGRRRSAPAGVLKFSNARLSDTERAWLASDEGAGVREALYDRFASTKLDHGVADDHTLRVIELCVPVTLTATVTGPAGEGWSKELDMAGTLVRALGSHRQRGLGRCRITVSARA